TESVGFPVRCKSVDSTVTALLISHTSHPMKTAPSPSPHILLVDDNRDGLLVRRSLLEEIGYRVQIAGNGEEGLKLFEHQPFEVVVTDYKMPHMNGVELIERLRR